VKHYLPVNLHNDIYQTKADRMREFYEYHYGRALEREHELHRGVETLADSLRSYDSLEVKRNEYEPRSPARFTEGQV
jgi:hypothetical protein